MWKVFILIKFYLHPLVDYRFFFFTVSEFVLLKIIFQSKIDNRVIYFHIVPRPQCYILTPRPGLKMLFQGDTPEGSDTFQRPVIKRDRVGGLRLMIWDKVKVSLCHYSHAPEESNL